MSGMIPNLPGWLPDPMTGGTAYWDGRQFTGDRRPARRRFAATARHFTSGTIWLACGALLFVTGVRALWTPELWFERVADAPSEGTFTDLARAIDDADAAFSVEAFATSSVYIALAVGCAALGIYRLRGKGPTTKAVNKRLTAQQRIHQRWTASAAVDGSRRGASSSPRRPRGATTDKIRSGIEWAALNLTHVGRAHKAFERGDRTFEVTLRIDRTGHLRTVEQIKERGWVSTGERKNPKLKSTTVTPHSDGSHTVVRKSTQTATFYFVRDTSLGA